jgi:hypothetical protein
MENRDALSGMAMSTTYTLHIDAYTPETIPMARLALYMQQLAMLLGHESAVHFEALRPGSTRLVSRVDREDVPKVASRLDRVRRGDGTADAVNAQREIDRLLAEDNASGAIYEGDGARGEVIAFPGIRRVPPATYGPFNQEGSLDGLLISVGGADRTVHVQLQNGDIKYAGIETDRETARALAKHMYEPIRIFGTGRWKREADGQWLLKTFRLRSFAALRADNVKEAAGRLREVEGSDWSKLDDPLAVLRALRDQGNAH